MKLPLELDLTIEEALMILRTTKTVLKVIPLPNRKMRVFVDYPGPSLVEAWEGPKVRFKFKDYEGNLVPRKYPNGRLAIEFVDDDGGCITVCSINLPNEDLDEGQIFIKDWSENEGMLEALLEAGVVIFTGERVPSGYVQAPKCRLSVSLE